MIEEPGVRMSRLPLIQMKQRMAPAPEAVVETRPGPAPLKSGHTRLCGVPMACLDFAGLCEQVDARIRSRTPGFIVTPNVDHICMYHRNPALRAAYADAFLALPDGTPLMWAARLLRRPLGEKLSGSDLVPWLCAHAAEREHRVFFFGAAEGIAAKAAENLKKRHPSLNIAGAYCPPLGFEKDPDANAAALDAIRNASPDLLFVALGAPKQELWMHRHYQALGVPVCLGIGAALDFAAGHIRRAPRLVQHIGLEWLWRLCREPRRLWRRYLIEDSYFAVLMWRDIRETLKAAGSHRSSRPTG